MRLAYLLEAQQNNVPELEQYKADYALSCDKAFKAHIPIAPPFA